MKNFLDAYRQKRKLTKLPALLAQDLEVLAGALRVGSSFTQAVQVASQETEGPLADEWRLLLHELQMGAPLSRAMLHFEDRCPLPAIRSLVSTVTLVQDTGGNLAHLLSTQADLLKQEIAFQEKLNALTTQGKMSGLIVSLMPFLILAALSVLMPDIVRPLFTTPLGWGMLAGVVIMVTMGGLLIKKIVTIEV